MTHGTFSATDLDRTIPTPVEIWAQALEIRCWILAAQLDSQPSPALATQTCMLNRPVPGEHLENQAILSKYSHSTRPDFQQTPPGRRAQNAALFTFPGGGKVYSCFPPYHLAGVQAFTILPIFYESIAVFGPSSMSANGHLLSEIVRHVEPKAVYVPPAVIDNPR